MMDSEVGMKQCPGVQLCNNVFDRSYHVFSLLGKIDLPPPCQAGFFFFLPLTLTLGQESEASGPGEGED